MRPVIRLDPIHSHSVYAWNFIVDFDTSKYKIQRSHLLLKVRRRKSEKSGRGANRSDSRFDGGGVCGGSSDGRSDGESVDR